MHATTAKLFARVQELIAKNRLPNGDSPMVLATARDERPSARFVLLKEFDERGPVFYTNLQSQKGRDLEANPHAALLFYWPAAACQLRISGTTETVDPAAADAYWKTRDRESQLAGAASPQSEPLSKKELVARVESIRRACEGTDIPRPAHWGGVRVIPETIEFWYAGEHRLHDRERWERRDRENWDGEPIAP